ncbi:MAG: hypothetical protein WCT03_09570 [Candidatus Obscuribacterales bacterium]|jgi:hypothetical protein
MTNDYHGLYSISTNQHVHVNHGWWCTECTNHLFEIDKQTDHTKEWVDVMRQWSTIGFLWLWDTFLAFGSAVISIVLGIAWILLCFFEGVDSDTRIYEQRLKDRDGLERPERDGLTGEYNQLLKERHYLVIGIDQCKSNLGKDWYVSKEKSYKGPEQDFIERGCKSTPPNPRTEEDKMQLETYQDRLWAVEKELCDLEGKLRTHHAV